jgi:hypothetical protein
MTPYRFDNRLAVGQKGESLLDTFFSQWADIQPASSEQQRQGIDRVFISRESGKQTLVEYKTDWKVAVTGNVFLETVSVDRAKKQGWLYTSQAEMLVYFVPQTDMIYCVQVDYLRAVYLPQVTKFREAAAENEGYRTWGILVPLTDFALICESIDRIN